MADKLPKRMSRDQRIEHQNELFRVAANEQEAARQKVRANMLRLRALRLAREAEEAKAAEAAPTPARRSRSSAR